jgi:hypothetical protein
MLKTKTERITFFCGIMLGGGAFLLMLLLRDMSTPLIDISFVNNTDAACRISSLHTSDGKSWRDIADVATGARVNVKPWEREVFKSQLILRLSCGTDNTTLAFSVPQAKALELHGGRAIIQKGQQGLSIDFTGSGLLESDGGVK